ncbi:MAG: hypothetical protein KTR29_09670 [Rhodothermaceae bacterium]|nr:hypothetical protein [Rhodothermaceae bacterium]
MYFPARSVLFAILFLLVAVDSYAQVNERRSKSQITGNVYTCLEVFDDFSASCAGDYWVFELRWTSRENAPSGRSIKGYSPLRSFLRGSSSIPLDEARSGRIEGGILLGVDGANSTPPPSPIPDSPAAKNDFRPTISNQSLAPDSSDLVQHNGFYFAQVQAAISLPSPLDPERFSVNVIGGAGFAWLKGKGPSPGVAGVVGRKGIPVLSYGAEVVTYFDRFNVRLQLNNMVFHTGHLDYVYQTDNGGEEIIRQDVQSIRKLNLLVGVGYVLFP